MNLNEPVSYTVSFPEGSFQMILSRNPLPGKKTELQFKLVLGDQ